MRNKIVLRKRRNCFNVWPILEKATKSPDKWSGWPDKKRFAFVITHDVDTVKGLINCLKLTEIEDNMGFKSSFNFVPKKYNVSPELRETLTNNGFEVGVHGLIHDGKLYLSKAIFLKRAKEINYYLKEWKSLGFRSPSMHGNLDWILNLDIEYDSSTFDTDPFEPQPLGVGTIFPFWVKEDHGKRGYIELPYTLPQDSTIFIFMKEKTINVWKQKLDWIVKHGGMALINIHPDYINFDGSKLTFDEYPVQFYDEFLQYVKDKYKGEYWHVLPKDMALFWSTNMKNCKKPPEFPSRTKNCLCIQ